MKFTLLVVMVLSFLLSSPTWAKKKKRKKRRSQVAIVQVDGAAVYKVANFDSPIIAYLNKGRKIRASKKIYPGIGGLGSFYKVRLRKGKYGYVTDVDLFPAKKTGSLSGDASGDIFTPQGGDIMQGPAMSSSRSGGSIAAKRYIGVSYSLVNYSEEVVGRSFTESLGFFGLKVSGPGALFTKLPLELNVMALFGAPTYYSTIFDQPEGYLVISDVLYIMPLLSKAKYMLYAAAGPALVYSSYRASILKLSNGNNIPFDLQTINVGISGAGGLAFKLGKSFIIKAEGKYIFENQGYLSFGGSLQISY